MVLKTDTASLYSKAELVFARSIFRISSHTAIIISSDADLILAINSVQEKGKTVRYIGFSLPDKHNPANIAPLSSLIQQSDIQQVLTETDLKKFIKNTPLLAKEK